MDEVDYSEFLYKNNSFVPPEKKPERKEKRIKKPRDKKSVANRVFTVATVVILCFAIVFACVNFFSKGKLLKSIYSMIFKNEYSYYLVVSSYPTREMAYAGTLKAEQTGGAGYVFCEDNNYNVVLGVYTSKKNAQSVVDKNQTFFIYTLSYSTSSNELANLIDGLVRDVGVSTDNIDAGTFTESELNNVINNQIILFSSYETNNEKEEELVSFVLSCLNGISPGITERTSLLFRTRHMLCSVLFSANEVFS